MSDSSALDGIRVLDFSWAIAGPWATTLLSFLGAEVIRIESQARLDITRREMLWPLALSQPYDLPPNQGLAFNRVNLGKLSVTLNLSQPKAIELAKGLVRISDVVLDNFQPGVMQRLGLDHEALRQVKPDIITLSSSCRGGTGPERNYLGYAPVSAALGGLAHITGYPDEPPSQTRVDPDIISATAAALAILASLYHRRRTGEGQHIDLSQWEVISWLIGPTLMEYVMNRRNQERKGNRDDIMAPHGCYRCRGEDKWVSIAVATDDEWSALCQAMGNPEWTMEQRFADPYLRWHNQEELDRYIEEWTQNYSPYEVMQILQGVGVAAVPSMEGDDLVNDPHLRERGILVEVEHPELDKFMVIGPPWKLSQTSARIRRHAPLLGEHNRYVFGELLGMGQQQIDHLIQEKVIY